MRTPLVLLLDPDAESRENIEFVLGIAKFQVRSFADGDECLNWLSVMPGESDDIVSVVLSGGLERGAIADFASGLERSGRYLPLLIVDRFKCTIQKNELLRQIFTSLPLYVCEAAEIVVMLNHFKVLKSHLEAKSRGFRFLFQGQG